MKDQMLKMAKVKSEKEFYKKFPTEEAFMAKHGKALKKAAMGSKMVQTQLKQLTDFGNPPIAQNGFAFGDAITNVNAMNAGITKEEQMRRNAMAELQSKQQAPSKGGGFLDDISGIAQQFMGGADGGADGGFDMRKGGKLKKAQGGFDFGGLGKAIGAATQSKGGLGNSLLDMFGGDSSAFDKANPAGVFGKGGVGTGAGNFSKGLGAGAGQAGLGILNSASDILGGVQQMKEQKNAIKKADQTAQISGVTAQAAESQDISMSNRKYVRPEDALVQPGQLGSPQGTGTNYLAQNGKTIDSTGIYTRRMLSNIDMADRTTGELRKTFTKEYEKNANDLEKYTQKTKKQKGKAQYGDMIGGNPTEIQNTYNPGNLYSDLGYEPLNDSNPKQFTHGGHLPTAEFGDYFQNSGQASIGKGVGSAIGSAFFGPLGGAVGGALGSVVGNVFGGADDANKLANFQTQTKENTERSAWAAGAKSLHGANSSFMEDGGWMNPEYNPQVIAKFGDLTAQDFYNASKEMRSGGHLAQVPYTPPSARALQTYEYGGQMAMGGDLQVARGKAEPMSYNPYLPEGGETVMFKGPSHADGGMDIQYGQNGVEVEGGEPAVKLQDGGDTDGNLVVFGNMKIDDYAAQEIEDPKAKGKKYKNYVADLSKVEAKQNKILNKSSDLIELADTNNPFDQLTMNAGRANLMGANMKLKDIASKKQNAAIVQNAILDTAQERGIESDALAQGKIKPMKQSDMGKFGKKLAKAQKGNVMDFLKKIPAFNTAPAEPINIPYQQGYSNTDLPTVTVTGNRQLIGGPSVPEFVNLTDKRGPNYAFATTPEEMAAEAAKGKGETKKNSKFGDAALMVASGLADYFRPVRQFPLDPSETMAEQYALGNNQVDPVYAQTYQPMLDQPYDISLQDQINAIDAQANAAIRASGQNPAAQAQIMAQSLQAKQQVYGNQFRANQENKNRVYQGNRAAINDSAFKNMGILDNQQVRQSQAKSATKAQTIAALSSISDKVTRNKQENLIAAVNQNRNNFRIDSEGRAINFNNPAQFNMSGNPFSRTGNQQGITTDSLGNKLYPIYNKDGSIKGYTAGEAKNGVKVKARNGSIVKALKSL